MVDGANGSQAGLTKGARITGDQRSSLGTTFGERYAAGESIRSIAIDTGRSYGFVHGVLKESGASLRGRGGATRGPRRTSEQAADVAGTASPVATKARAKAEKDKPAPAKLVDKAVEKVSDKAARAKSTKDDAKSTKVDVKSTKDDKAKKKAEAKKPGKKGKKG
ncbi:MAG TPA: helix-turn-helix domain-containing protein [Friedmanniella sp.]